MRKRSSVASRYGRWEEAHGALSREEWRANLTEFLDLVALVADPELQQEVLVEKSSEHDFDPPFTDFEIGFDLNASYMGRLNLAAGLDWAESEGFLLADEKDRIVGLRSAVPQLPVGQHGAHRCAANWRNEGMAEHRASRDAVSLSSIARRHRGADGDALRALNRFS